MASHFRDMIFGRRQPQPPITSRPEGVSSWESIAKGQRNAGRGLSDLFKAVSGKAPNAVHVCPEGHVVPQGSNICSYGHWAG